MKHLFLIILMCALSATAQTVTQGSPGGASTLTSPTFYAYSNTNFIYWFPTFTTNPGVAEIGGKQLVSSNTFQPLEVSFAVSNNSAIEWASQNQAYGTYQVSCFDGWTNYFSSVSPHGYLYPNSQVTLYRVDMPYATNWLVTIFLGMDDGYSGLFEGVNLPSGSTFIWTNSFAYQRKVVVYGDSYAKGYDPTDGTEWLSGFAQDLNQFGSNVKVMSSGVGGQGYTNVYDGGNYQTRLTNDLFNISPWMVIVTGSINDNGYTTNQVYQAANLLYGTIVTNLPSANIVVIGTWYKDASPNSSMIANDQMQQAAAAVWGLHYVSPVQQLWGQGGTGNDGVHPTATTYLTYATKISTNLYAWYGANWNTNVQPIVPHSQMAVRWK